MAVSIEDVAKKAQVSISTVSRVVNRRNLVNEQTRKRVERAIEELGYEPNVFARGLMLRKSNILGLILPDLHGEFYSEIIRGANTKARELGYHLMISSVTPEEDGASVLATVGNHGLVDGVAVMVSEMKADTPAQLAKLKIPLVVLDGKIDGLKHDSVVIDQRHGATAMMQHLIGACHCQRIVFVGGLKTNLDTMERLRACSEVLRSEGKSLPPQDIHHLDYEYATAYDLGVAHVHEWARDRACVFAANDEMAAGIIDAALAAGLSVPGDLGVVGFDDTRIAQMTRPRLTTVHVPMSGMGASAVELLCKRLAEPERPPASIVLESQLVVRESCGTA